MRNSLVGIWKQGTGKFLRYEDDAGTTIAEMKRGKLSVTEAGVIKGYFVHPHTKKLARQTKGVFEDVRVPKPPTSF